MNKYKEAYDFILTATNGGEGMVKEMNIIRELVEKATPKKASYMSNYFGNELVTYECPHCRMTYGRVNIKVNINVVKYCPKCGQAIDWSEEDDC